MEVKNWTYEEFPEFEMEGIEVIDNNGEEIGVSYFNDVEYDHFADGTTLHLQILMPKKRNEPDKKWPTIVYVQGSAWFKQNCYKELPQLAVLARMGYVIAVVEYRHSGIAAFPSPVIDAHNAIRFMKINADKYSVDVDRMVLAGSSSGGHTAVFGGILKDDDKEVNKFKGVSADVKGIVDLYGCVTFMIEDSNPCTTNHNMPDSPEGLEAGGIDLNVNIDKCKQMSAECNIFEDTVLPPVLIMHGKKDRQVNAKCSAILFKRLIETGHKAKFYLVKLADHGGAEFWSERALKIMKDFIDEVTK